MSRCRNSTDRLFQTAVLLPWNLSPNLDYWTPPGLFPRRTFPSPDISPHIFEDLGHVLPWHKTQSNVYENRFVQHLSFVCNSPLTTEHRYSRRTASTLKPLLAFQLVWVDAELRRRLRSNYRNCMERLTSTQGRILRQKQRQLWSRLPLSNISIKCIVRQLR